MRHLTRKLSEAFPSFYHQEGRGVILDSPALTGSRAYAAIVSQVIGRTLS